MNSVVSTIVVAFGLIPVALAAEQVTAPQASDMPALTAASPASGAEKPRDLRRERREESEPVFPESRCEVPGE